MSKAEMKEMSRRELIKEALSHVRKAVEELDVGKLTRDKYNSYARENDLFTASRVKYYTGKTWSETLDEIDNYSEVKEKEKLSKDFITKSYWCRSCNTMKSHKGLEDNSWIDKETGTLVLYCNECNHLRTIAKVELEEGTVIKNTDTGEEIRIKEDGFLDERTKGG